MRLHKGERVARLAAGPQDLIRAQELRHQGFWAARGLDRPDARDSDGFDAACQHVLVEDAGKLVATFRLRICDSAAIGASYSAQFYDLSPLTALPGKMLEMGRFCLDPGVKDPDILRLCWAAITQLVDAHQVALMFGCTSFAGADPGLHASALAYLHPHIGPDALRPLHKTAQTVPLAAPHPAHDPRAGLAALPPLLRSYLGLGGWVSDHAVRDPDLDTLHVFTAVEVARIPPARARALRALSG